MTDLLALAEPHRRDAIVQAASGVDYSRFEAKNYSFDYEALMQTPGLTWDEVRAVQRAHKVGDTPLLELAGITKLVRSFAPPGHGATLLLKDEAANASGSFKARRASLAVHLAKERGYRGVVAATSGNYGAAVASQATMQGLKCIVVQEAFDSRGVGQPEILEKARACAAYGAEVVQLSVGPELFLVLLQILEETGFFNASLYAPYSVLGIETLGVELAEQCRQAYSGDPDVVVVGSAGGGNLTGTARGLRRAGSDATVVAASVDLTGLHMASDGDFNRKSFTTCHTGFSVPFLLRPDRVDVPRSACRPLRYMDRMLTVDQGSVFYATELLATLDGLERGAAGNTSLAVAIPLAARMREDQILIVQESEYTGAGKHHHAQLSFARDNGIEVLVGDPRESIPGTNVIIPDGPEKIGVNEIDLGAARRRYVETALNADIPPTETDMQFFQDETRLPADVVTDIVRNSAR